MSRTRGYIFTLNNYTPEQELVLQDLDVKYIIYGREIAPTTGTPHLQGYFYLHHAKTFKSTKKFVGIDSIHLEQAKGSPQSNKKYCSKDANVFTKGEAPNQGRRADIDDYRDMVKSGASLREIVDSGANWQNIRITEKYLTLYEKPRDFVPEVYWFYGKSGTGKTRKVFETAKELDLDLYVCDSNAKWWDGYDGHNAVLIDDMRGTYCSYNRLLRLLDRYECRVEVKGGYRQLRATHMFITSPFHPQEMYSDYWSHSEKDTYEQLSRRITEIKMFATI